MFKFSRSARTAFSEHYVIFYDGKNIGSLDIHILKYINGTLVVQPFLEEEELEQLIMQIDSEIVEGIEPREDFIFTVYFGKEVGFYSDSVSKEDRSWEPAKTKDIEDISELIKSALGKAQHAKGKLNEFVAIEFFEKLGFSAKKSPPELDHKKIDVIAENETCIVYVQVKSGQISDKSITSLVENVEGISSEKTKEISVIAKEYSVFSEQLRAELEDRFGIKIYYYHSYQVLSSCSEYRSALN